VVATIEVKIILKYEIIKLIKLSATKNVRNVVIRQVCGQTLARVRVS